MTPDDQSTGVRGDPRTYLFVPGDAEDKLSKALTRGADALIVDLEDAVAASSKSHARQVTRRWLETLPPARQNPVEVWIRINPGTLGHDDLAEVLSPAIQGVCVAKTEGARSLEELDVVLGAGEARLSLKTGSMSVQPQLESARALLSASEIAVAPRVTRLQIGEVDLAADSAIEPGEDQLELLFARSLLVMTSAALGLSAPVGPVSIDFQDEAQFRRSSLALRRIGFRSRACIHPAQVVIAREVFTPSPQEIESAQRVVKAYDDALAQGVGIVTDAAGRMIDEAVVRSSRRLLAMRDERLSTKDDHDSRVAP